LDLNIQASSEICVFIYYVGCCKAYVGYISIGIIIHGSDIPSVTTVAYPYLL